MTHNYKIAGILVALFVTALLLFLAPIAKANPLAFLTPVQTATATSSVAYMTSGLATSTLTFDSYAQGQIKATDKGILLLQTVASSTSSVFTIAFQYSQDNIDWYNDNTTATTTNTNVAVPQVFSFTATGTATTSRALPVNFPTRYVRVQSSVLGASGAVWQQIVPQRQSN